MSLAADHQKRKISGELLAAILRGAIILTPNVRAARRLHCIHDAYQRSQGHSAWQPARIFSWSGWTAGLWNDATIRGTVHSVLLNRTQEETLWTRILDEVGELGLRSSKPLARTCSQAMRLLGAYDLEDQFARFNSPESTDAGSFRNWYREFLHVAQHDRLLPRSHLDAEIASLLRSKAALHLGSEYLLYGFLALTPSQSAVVAALQSTGARVEQLAAITEDHAAPILLRCENPAEEITACCQWIQSTLAANRQAEITVVVPDLDECRPELERTLRATVAPWLEDVTATQTQAVYEFSSGRSLGHLPMIADALLLLSWCDAALSIDDAGKVLRSPHLALTPSPERGAELEAWTLRDLSKLRRAATLTGNISLCEAEKLFFYEDPLTANTLSRFARNAQQKLQGAHSCAGFADRVHKVLEAAGWMHRGFDSVEFQAVRRWNDALDQVASLDLFGERIRFSEWLQILTATVNDTHFAPENTGAPIQVVTPAEAEGCTCDYIWFLHAEENTWPQYRDPNPLLPRSLQRTLGMPGADTQQDEDHARVLTLHYTRSTSRSHFSFAAMRTEGEGRPASLVRTLPGLIEEAAVIAHAIEPLALEWTFDDELLPALPETAKGGVGIITSQGQCGFRAFAEMRLMAREADAVSAGMSPAERGNLVHEALYKFWDRLKTHENLSAATEHITDSGRSERDVLLEQCIAEVLPQAKTTEWDAAYLQVQRERLHRLLSDWLDVELQRTPFRVDAMEYEIPDAQVGPLRMKIRVDRIDRVEQPDGNEAAVLIDYKTGSAERKDWFGERPDAPQLPTYAIAGRIDDVQGIAFGRVRVGKLGMDFQEMLADRSLLGITSRRNDEPSFADRMQEWELNVTALAEAFARGEAVVEPKDYLTTCKHCASRLLCRMDVSRLEPDNDLLEDNEEEIAL